MKATNKTVQECDSYARRIEGKLKEVKTALQDQIKNTQDSIKNILGRFVGNNCRTHVHILTAFVTLYVAGSS